MPHGAHPGRGIVRRHPTLAAALGCLVSFAAFWTVQRLLNVTMIDLMVYRAEGFTVRNGESLYDMVATSAHLPNTYPPFAALLFTPLTLLGVPEMRTVATASTTCCCSSASSTSHCGWPGGPGGCPGPPRRSRSRRCWCGANRSGRRCATARSIC